MSEQFNQYKRSDERKIGYHWVIFDNEMPDDVLRELMAPVEPADIDRGAETSVVGFYSDGPYDYELLHKVREWEKNFAIPLREEKAKKAAAESQARFEEYYCSLDLGD